MMRIAAGLLLFCLVVQASAQDLKLVGQARLQVLLWPVYDSRLYSADGRYREGQRPLRLELQYLRDIEAGDLVEQTRREWQRLPHTPPGQAQWLSALSGLWPDIRENDVLALVLDERGQSTFLYNGQRLGQIEDPAFGQSFLDIWLSTHTSQPELRLALIGDR